MKPYASMVELLKDPSPFLEKICLDLKEFGHVKAVILFGSLAKGTANVHSDIDLCIFQESQTVYFELRDLEAELCDKYHLEIDITPYTPASRQDLSQYGILMHELLNHGKFLLDEVNLQEKLLGDKEMIEDLFNRSMIELT